MFNKKLLVSIVSFLPLMAFAETYNSVKTSVDDQFYVKMGGLFTVDVVEDIKNAFPATIAPFDGVVNKDYFRGRVNVDRSKLYKPTHQSGVHTNFGLGKHIGESGSIELDFSLDNMMNVASLSKNRYFSNITGDVAFENLGFNFSVATINYVYDADTVFSYISPYISAGFGVSRVEFINSTSNHLFSYPFTVQFRAGIKFDYNKSIPFYLGYKMISLLESNSEGNVISKMPMASREIPARSAITGCDTTPAAPGGPVPLPAQGELSATEPIASSMNAKYMLHSFEFGINLDLS